MTREEFAELERVETAKLAALKQIVDVIEKLRDETDDDAVEWLMEKLNE